MLIEETPIDGSVLLLGTPSVFIEMARLQNPPTTTLLDWNDALINHLSRSCLPDSFALVHHNLLSGSLWKSNQGIDVVLSDPPWYPEHYTAFLTQAAHVIRIGGTIIFVLLPINTRSGAITDRWKIFDTAHRLGLHIQTLKPNAIKYTTPIFESTSLNRTNIKISKNWRSGDIVVFKKVCDPSRKVINDLLLSTVTDDHKWAEVLIGRYKIKLRGPFNDYSATPQLIAIEKDNVLPTVSRRYEGRKFIDLWLWDNRVFAVKGKAAFLAALYTLSGRAVPNHLSLVSKVKHNRALRLLQRLMGIYDCLEQKIA